VLVTQVLGNAQSLAGTLVQLIQTVAIKEDFGESIQGTVLPDAVVYRVLSARLRISPGERFLGLRLACVPVEPVWKIGQYGPDNGVKPASFGRFPSTGPSAAFDVAALSKLYVHPGGERADSVSLDHDICADSHERTFSRCARYHSAMLSQQCYRSGVGTNVQLLPYSNSLGLPEIRTEDIIASALEG